MLCECGCGQPTKIAPWNNRRDGIIRGQPYRFVFGHHVKLRTAMRYPKVGTEQGQRYAHRARAERALGHPLPKGAQVHHVDGSMSSSSALVICENQAYHRLLHNRMKVRKLGGDPNTQLCCYACRQLKPFDAFGAARFMADGRSRTCKQCISERGKRYWVRKRARHELERMANEPQPTNGDGADA